MEQWKGTQKELSVEVNVCYFLNDFQVAANTPKEFRSQLKICIRLYNFQFDSSMLYDAIVSVAFICSFEDCRMIAN